MRQKFLIILLAVCFIGIAHADLIPSFVPPTVQNGLNCGANCWLYQYQVNLTAGSRIGPSVPAVDPGNNFFTLYDFAGFNNFTQAATGWYATSQGTGNTPALGGPGGNPIPVPDGGTANITFHYTGPLVIADQDQNIGPFYVGSIYPSPAQVGWYSSQSAKTTPTDSQQTNSGHIETPFVPEPVTFVLVGAGLLALGIMRRRTA